MKVRNGFVSNSSSSSFTIYGWKGEDLSKYLASLSPAFEGMDFYLDEWTFQENLEKLWDGEDWDITHSRDRDGGQVFGLGVAGIEVDHYLPPHQNWEDFKYPEPSDERRKKFDELAEKLNFPKPQLYQDTFFDG